MQDDQTNQPGGQSGNASAPASGGATQEGSISKGEGNKFLVEVDQNICIGAASCVALASKVFQLNSENKAYVVDPKGDSDEEIIQAAKSCPTNAIKLVNKETGKIEYP